MSCMPEAPRLLFLALNLRSAGWYGGRCKRGGIAVQLRQLQVPAYLLPPTRAAFSTSLTLQDLDPSVTMMGRTASVEEPDQQSMAIPDSPGTLRERHG